MSDAVKLSRFSHGFVTEEERQHRETAINDHLYEVNGGKRKQQWGKFELELPFQVDLNFRVNCLASLGGCKCLYVEMQATEANIWNANTVAAGMTSLDDLVK
jgi:hypothetical protein